MQRMLDQRLVSAMHAIEVANRNERSTGRYVEVLVSGNVLNRHAAPMYYVAAILPSPAPRGARATTGMQRTPNPLSSPTLTKTVRPTHRSGQLTSSRVVLSPQPIIGAVQNRSTFPSMHEYSLVLSLIERVEQEMQAHRATQAHRIHVSVGELSGVVAELLESAFEIARESSSLKHTALSVTRVAARWRCASCDTDVDSRTSLTCGRCGKQASLVEGGDILFESVELEVPPE